MTIGDGSRTLFWLHNWADSRPLIDTAIGSVSDDDMFKTVSEYWEGNNGWKWDQFTSLLPPDIVQDCCTPGPTQLKCCRQLILARYELGRILSGLCHYHHC